MCAAVVLAAAIAAPRQAGAWTPATSDSCPEQQVLTGGGEVTVVVHVSASQSHLDPDRTDRMVEAVEQVNDEFNQIDATSARVVSTEVTEDPFTFGTWYEDPDPTIHIGFVPEIEADENAIAGVQRGPRTSCEYDEAHMAILDADVQEWHFGTPWDRGEPFYDVGKRTASGKTWFRPSYLHELLHAFGLAHSNDTYAMTNYGEKPWANRPPADAMRPLPDDVRGIRHLYPADGVRTEVAALNTWFEPAAEADEPAEQLRVCQPSRGKEWADVFGANCGSNSGPNGTVVCEGDNLRVRVAVANYSTSDVDVAVLLWFSYDDVLSDDRPQEFLSESMLEFELATGSSALRGHMFEVPDIIDQPGSDYHAIAEVIAVPEDQANSEHAYVSDWVPLRGTVTLC
jgi:hypothetical protein